jgi:NADH:ubiquinone oxidoreductase subunit 5 (subunit L)/multisubunit Na+/H+ antiporter MnhA subunit/ribosomal protein S17E
MINILFGGLLALMQRNIKQIIAYSSMSQTGFMLIGIGLVGILGESGGLALVGTILYMINHAMFKLLLFFGAGVVYMILREMSLNKIYGFGKKKHRLKAFFLIGTLGIIGMPGFNGYTSKTLVHEAIIEAQHLTHLQFFDMVEMAFYFGGALTVAYMLKLFIALFVEDNAKYYGQYRAQFRKRAQLPLAILSGIVIYIGIFPNTVLNVLTNSGEILGYAMPHHINFFSYEALAASFITIVSGIIIYIFIVQGFLIMERGDERLYLNPSYNWFSLERDLYFPVAKGLFDVFSVVFKYIDVWLVNLAGLGLRALEFIGNLDTAILPRFEWDTLLIEIDKRTKKVDLKKTVVQRIGGATEKFRRDTSEAKSLFDDQKESIEKVKALQSKKVKDIFEGYNIRLSSITYSLFMLGIVIVLSYLFVFMKH